MYNRSLRNLPLEHAIYLHIFLEKEFNHVFVDLSFKGQKTDKVITRL